MKAASVVVVFLTVGAGDARIGGSVALDNASQAARPAVQRFDLAAAMTAGRLRAVNPDVAKLKDRSDAVHVSERADNGVVWIAGSDFAEGTIEVDLRGRDVLQQSFLGLALHGKDDRTYESVYVRLSFTITSRQALGPRPSSVVSRPRRRLFGHPSRPSPT